MLRRLRDTVAVGAVALLVVSVAQAAPIGTLKQFRIPTNNGNPLDITQGSDGNFWFTESHVNPPQWQNHHVGRITPSGQITEFLVCDFCFPSDIAEGSGGVLYFTRSDPGLGRITTAGTVLPDVVPPNTQRERQRRRGARGRRLLRRVQHEQHLALRRRDRRVHRVPDPDACGGPVRRRDRGGRDGVVQRVRRGPDRSAESGPRA